jgi:glycosyltransferase involved in cell wall biosynthesis
MASTPAITVLVPVHNNAAGVRRTLEALAELMGEHEQLEVIVVDDGSTDDTPSVLPDAVRPFGRHQIITTSNQGAAIARNVAASVATGEFLVFLDANDEPLHGWVAGLARQLEPGVGIAHCEPDFSDPAIRTDHGFLLPGCFAVSRELFSSLGGYDPQLRFAENSDLVERAHAYCAANGLRVSFTDEPLLAVHEVSDPRRYDADRLHAMSYLLDRDATALRRDRERMERLASIGAVSAARLGQPQRARTLAWTAARARPTNPRNWARLALTAVPFLGRRRWPHTEVL